MEEPVAGALLAVLAEQLRAVSEPFVGQASAVEGTLVGRSEPEAGVGAGVVLGHVHRGCHPEAGIPEEVPGSGSGSTQGSR